MSRFKLLYFVIFIINLHRIHAQISDKRLCVDEECKVPISHAKTLLRYSSPDSRILSFAPNVDITIYSKSAGSREDLWGGEINGKRGYIPKHLVRETKILQKPTVLVDTEFSNETDNQVPSPNKVQEAFEVVDGTTIYMTPQEGIQPSSTESPVQPTAVPSEGATPTNPDTNQNATEEEDDEDEEDEEGDVEDESESEEEPEDALKVAETQPKTPEAETSTKTDDVLKVVETQSSQEDPQTLPVSLETSPEADDGLKVAETSPKVDDGLKVAETLPEAALQVGDGLKVVETLPQADHGLKVPETLPQAEVDDGLKVVETLPQADDGLKVAETLPQADDGLKVAETLPRADDGLKVVETLLQADDGLKEAETLPQADDGLKVAETLPRAEANDGLKVVGTLPQTDDGLKVPETLPQVDDGLKIAETSPKVSPQINDAFKVAETLPQVDDALKVSETLPQVDDALKVAETLSQVHDALKVAETSPEAASQVDDGLKPAETSSEEAPKIDSEDKSTKVPKLEVPLVEEPVNATEDGAAFLGDVTTLSPEIEVPEPFDDNFEVTPDPLEVPQAKEEVPTVLPPLGLFGGSFGYNQENVATEGAAKEETKENEEPEQQSEEIVDESREEIENTPATVDEPNDAPTPQIEDPNEEPTEEGPGFLAALFSLFTSEDVKEEDVFQPPPSIIDVIATQNEEPSDATPGMDLFAFNSDVLLYLVTTAVSVIVFLFGYVALDKSKQQGPLIARINKLEKDLLVVVKENQILQERGTGASEVSDEVLEDLKSELMEMSTAKSALEEQVQSLEKELENSTEVGMELNRMLSEILSSESGSEVLKDNVEHLQRQLVEQQATINSVNETLAITNTENHELRLELDLSNKKVFDLQAELDKLLLNVLKIEEEKEAQQAALEAQVNTLKQNCEEVVGKLRHKDQEVKDVKNRLEETERKLELKIKEHDVLRDTLKQLKVAKNKEETVKNLLEVGDIKAELQLLKSENQRLVERIRQEEEMRSSFEKKAVLVENDLRQLKDKYDEADKIRAESQTKLEVLSNYFKDREAQWQKEISKHEALWAEKEGEATSTTERIKFMQEQLQNYKDQTESLKQEIMSQEIELKSQISVLEKKAHENWVSARQAERKAEDAKQEAAQLRHRLTLRERALQDDKTPHRLEQNGDLPESPASPPLLYGRDHITKSPPLPGLPPFLPPPPGVPFMPPPLHGVPPFIPPPSMFPGDHRPPPLGRMSSPPLNRYSPSSRGYSPYDRGSSSPSDSEYGTSPPHRRGYSPFNNRGEERRDYKRMSGRSNGRSLIKGGSSGSGHSNESLEKIRQQSKV